MEKDAVVDVMRALPARPTSTPKRPTCAQQPGRAQGQAILSADPRRPAAPPRLAVSGGGTTEGNLAAAVLLRGNWPRLYAEGGALFDPTRQRHAGDRGGVDGGRCRAWPSARAVAPDRLARLRCGAWKQPRRSAAARIAGRAALRPVFRGSDSTRMRSALRERGSGRVADAIERTAAISILKPVARRAGTGRLQSSYDARLPPIPRCIGR
jgi:23S rRNA (guanine2445-N2)-methyltransferase / 23S rRNA (guanine2069-N7)-methyltransferase